MYTTSAFEWPVHFLSEQRTGRYIWYSTGVAELKNALDAKNSFKRRALPGLERSGA